MSAFNFRLVKLQTEKLLIFIYIRIFLFNGMKINTKHDNIYGFSEILTWRPPKYSSSNTIKHTHTHKIYFFVFITIIYNV